MAKLIAFADRHGVDRGRNVAVNAITTDGHIHDPVARLWPQTERLRAYIIDDQADSDARLQQAIAALWRYLNAPLSGLWYENQAANGQFVIEAAPATSLYHIVGAVVELWSAFGAECGSPVHARWLTEFARALRSMLVEGAEIAVALFCDRLSLAFTSQMYSRRKASREIKTLYRPLVHFSG